MTHYDPREYKEHRKAMELEEVHRKRKIKICWIAVFAVALAAYLYSVNANARETVRLYETDNNVPKHTGYAEQQSNGNWIFYDKHSRRTGSMDRDNMYSRDGKITERLYLLPKR